MINFSEGKLAKLIIHRIGNKYNSTPCSFSTELADINGEAYAKVFPDAFEFLQNLGEYYDFHHHNNIEQNEMYALSKKIFMSDEQFVEDSRQIANHLYEQTVQPNINAGDLIVCLIENIEFDNAITDAIVAIKCESRFPFFITKGTKNYDAALWEGINLKKHDKACMIANTRDQFTVMLYDKKDATNYWQRDFLNVQARSTDFNKTKTYLDVCKTFVTDQLEQEYEVNKTDKIDYLNRTVDYFKKNNEFNEQEFLGEVFQDKEVIKSFKSYKQDYVSENEIELDDTFGISDIAVKKQSKVFKSVLKLDKNFHVYIHGDKTLIEKGFDSKVGKSFYKIYFDEES